MIQHFDDPLAPAPIRDIPHILNYAWTTGEFPNASMQMTYAAISRFSDEDGDAQPLQKQILELVPDSASTVKRNIKSMIGLGFLDVSEERWAFDGRRNAYHLTARSRMFQVMPRDPERKPSSVLDAAFNKLDEIRERVADLERENARLRETMQALSAGQDVEMPALGGQIDSGQIDPTKKEEEELSGQFNNHTKESSSFLPGVPGQPESAGSELGVNMTSNTQPELQVEIIESIEAPWLTEMKIWVREHWSRLRHSSTNRDGFRATLPRVIAILADKGEENYRDSRTHWDAVWAEQEEAMAQQREDPSRAAASPQVPPPPEPPAVENVDPEAVSLYDRALELAREELPAEIVERHMAGCAGIAFRDDGGDRTLIIATGADTIYLQRRMYADIHRLVTRAAEQLCINCGDVEFSWGRVQPAS